MKARLAAHRDALDAMSDELLERETLNADDIARLFADVPKWRREDDGHGTLRSGPGPINRDAAA